MHGGVFLEQKSGAVALPRDLFSWVERFGDEFGFMPLVPVDEPNMALPGTQDRVRHMRKRASRGQPIFSRMDHSYFCEQPDPERAFYSTDPSWISWSGDEKAGLEFSQDRQYRYRAWNVWDSQKPIACFIGLHPTRGRKEEDKVKLLAIHAGCGGYHLVNLFAIVVDSYEELCAVGNEGTSRVGDWNDRVIRLTLLSSSFVVLAWGRCGELTGRSATITSATSNTVYRQNVYCYGMTKPHKASSGEGEYRSPIAIKDVEYGATLVHAPFKYMEMLDD